MSDVTIYVRGKKDTKRTFDAVKREAKETFDSVEKSAKKASKGILSSFGSVRNLLGAYLGVQGAKLFINVLGTIEEGWIGVAKTTGLAGDEMERLKDSIRSMSTEMKGIKLEEFQSVAETAGQLGIQGVENIKEFTRVVSMMKVATNLTAEAAAEDFAQIANILKEPITNLEKIGSVMNELSNTTTATASDLSNLTKRMGGAANLIGLTTAEIIGLSATLKDMGINIEVGGTAMSQVFTKMLSDTDKFAEVAGVSLSTFSDMIRNEPVEALRTLLVSMSEMSKFDAAASLKELGISGVRVGGVLLKLSGGLDVLEENLKTANDEWERGTSLQDEYTLASKSLFAEATSVSNAFKILAEELGTAFLPTIKMLLPLVTDLALGLAKLIELGSKPFTWAASAGSALSDLVGDVLGLEPLPAGAGGGSISPTSSGSVSAPADVNAPFGTFFSSFAVGTRFVSKTGIAQVHQGEEIANRNEVASNKKAQVNFGGITIPVTVVADKAPEQQAKELVRHIDKELKILKATYG